MNLSLTLTYLRLEKIECIHADVAQFAGGIGGITLVWLLIGKVLSDPAMRFAVTVPGEDGTVAALFGEFAVSVVLMTVMLHASNSRTLAPYTDVLCGGLVATYMTFEAPPSGMSMNPARSLASALAARNRSGLWIYFLAPPLGMLAAGELYARRHGFSHMYCAKLNHTGNSHCIFRCDDLVLRER